MKISDYIGSGVCIGLGVWWILFPASVIKFYMWFHRGRVKMAPESGIRLIGVGWVALIVIIEYMKFS